MPSSGRTSRGASSNRSGRFERFQSEVTPDDLDQAPRDDEEAPAAPRTTVTPEATRTILARNDSPDVPFDRSINPYRGCEHGCIYCFARPSHAYLGMSPGLDFETRIISKPHAAEALRRELARPSYQCEVVALGANTDPYQPVERRLGITRSVLGVLEEHAHPVTVVTKSDLVLRDADILERMARRRLAAVMLSVTTLDLELARRMEPRASTPARRIETIRLLRERGIPAGVLASPMIPGLNDAELEAILEAAAAAGASSAGYILVRLPLEIKDLFSEWLRRHYPMRARRILSLIRATRAGKLNDPEFGSRMRGSGVYADLLRSRFETACRRFKLSRDHTKLDTTQFQALRPDDNQLNLFN